MRFLALTLGALVALSGCDKASEPSKAGEAGKMDAPKGEAAKSSAPKHMWASFKPGSYVKLKTTSHVEVAGTKNKTETEMKQTLLEVTADQAVVEMEMSVAGTVQKTKMNIPLKGPEGKAADGPKPKTGSEKIEVGGKSYACTWTEIETEAGGNKTVTKTWQCEDVPGFTVKSVSKSSGAMSMESTTELVESVSK